MHAHVYTNAHVKHKTIKFVDAAIPWCRSSVAAAYVLELEKKTSEPAAVRHAAGCEKKAASHFVFRTMSTSSSSLPWTGASSAREGRKLHAATRGACGDGWKN